MKFLFNFNIDCNQCFKANIFDFFIHKISNYPNLRESIENQIISFIHNNVPKSKESILLLIKMELAYINIKHGEYIQYFSFAITLIYFYFSVHIICWIESRPVQNISNGEINNKLDDKEIVSFVICFFSEYFHSYINKTSFT